MIASKFVKCITKLFNLNPYHFLPSLKVCKPKLIPAIQENHGNEVEELYIENLCENVDLENVFKTRNQNVPWCKSDVSMLKGSNLNYTPTCHSVPCCNSNLSNLSGKILDREIQASVASITETKSTRTQSTCTVPVKECKSPVYILNQRKYNNPVKPFSAPCRSFNHDEAVRELCEKAMKTCAAARKIIYFYKCRETEQDSVRSPDDPIEKQPSTESPNKNQDLITKPLLSIIKFDKTTCPYCTLPSSIPQNYSCPFCAKNVKQCTCIHCPHCKKSRINAPYKKQNYSKTKFFKFDKPLSYRVASKINTLNTTFQERIRQFAEKHNPCDFQIESETFPVCKISKPKTEKLSSSKSDDEANQKQQRPKTAIDKNRKTKSLSQEGKEKPTNKKLKQSHISAEPICKIFKKIPKNTDFAPNLPNEDQKFPCLLSNTNEVKNCSKILKPLVKKVKSAKEQNLKKLSKSSERKLKMHGKQNVWKKQKELNTPLVLKQLKDVKVKKKVSFCLDKKRDNGSECSVNVIYSINAARPLTTNKNLSSIRKYSSKGDGSGPRDVLCDCPKALRKIGRCEQMEFDEYFGDCYKNTEYFQYDKYSYFTLEECLKKKHCPQPSSLKKDKCEEE